MKNLLILLSLIVAVGCSSVKTAYDYDQQVDFTKYTTYSMLEDNLTQAVGELNRNRIISTLETELSKKGLSKSDESDLLVDVLIKGKTEVEATATTTGTSYGYHRYGYGGGFSTTQVNYNEYTVGTLFITLIDSATEKIVWQGTGARTVEETASPEKREANITYAIQQILMNYPPTK